MLGVLVALSLVCMSAGQATNGNEFIIQEKNVLSPPYFNIATGKEIATTATCGTERPELFCKLTGGTNFEFSSSLDHGQVCDICDANDPEKSHPITNAIDGTEKWWQSPPLSRGNKYNFVNVTIHLGQVFHVAYVLVKFANSPRAGTWVLERSSDNGETFQPWQYFANTDSDCYNQFGMSSLEEITRDDSVICTSDYSGVVPLENGEVIVSMIKGRPGAHNFSHATILQEWSKATDVRLRFLRTKTLLGHLMAVSEQDDTVTRRYYYSIKDISLGGRCVCNGHADTCRSDPDDLSKLKCQCQHNTCGDSCEYCCPGFVQKAWRAAVPESTNECEACNCHGHSAECIYDEEVARRRLSLDLQGNYEGGGVCQNCQHNTAGVNCEQCASGYWRPSSVDPRDPNGCRACDCDDTYTVGTCEPNTGRCYCKVQYAGDRCDRCAPGFYEFPECKPCDCYYNGTLDEVCLPVDDACPCKYNFNGLYCNECAPGFYNFPQCDVCECDGEGVASDVCDQYTGACPCSDGFAGIHCTECAPGYFNYPLCQRCRCSDVGTTDEVCNPATGECYCGERFSGPGCFDCGPGYFGFPQCEACRCTSPGSRDNVCNQLSGKCECRPNYQGENCDQCAPEYYGYPNCVPCDCNLRGSLRTTCVQETGQCFCRENVGGRTCGVCNANYFNFPRCEECSCDNRGITSVVPGVCLAFTSGQCDCKENVIGPNCDMCKPLYYDLDRGCVNCNCFVQGTLDGVGECDGEDGSCWCKPYTCSQRCSQCEDGFYSLEELNYFGCLSCQCDVGGSMTSQCHKNTGQCRCKDGIGGRKCDRALDGYFHPTLYQNTYELEYGRNANGDPARFGFDEQLFPEFSMTGYVEFSVVQPAVAIPVTVHNDGLYRIVFRYVNYGSSAGRGNAVLVPELVESGGAEQGVVVNFDVTSSPRVVTASRPLVLNKGKWNLTLAAPAGVLVDYFVLLPSEYYEPSILDLTITNPCSPVLSVTENECVMFTHASLNSFDQINLVNDAPQSRVSAPSTAHPEMRVLEGISGITDDSEVTIDVPVPQPGKYVLVLEYASTESKFQMARLAVTDGGGNTYDDSKFNIYSCLYSFICRQVALGPLNEVAVFELSGPSAKVHIQTDIGGSFFVKSITTIPFDQWSMELVEPKPRCITTEGPQFDSCNPSPYKMPIGSFLYPTPGEETSATGEAIPQPPSTSDRRFFYLDGSDSTDSGSRTLQIPMNLPPGRYVFVLHYYNPDHTSFNPEVVIDGGIASTGGANVTYCPNENGCMAVVSTDDGRTVIDVTVPTTTFTIIGPKDKSFWIEEVSVISEDDYNPSLLNFSPSDKSSDFVRECSQQSFYNTLENPSEFCRDSVFSLTVDYNDGGLNCNCSGAGTIGGGDAICEKYGGQCPCRDNVVGRQCDRCKTGYFGFPDCQSCDCGGKLCDAITGDCICPPNTVEPDCLSCAPFTHSFHPLYGCISCDCNAEGVLDVADQGCDATNGQCNCKEHVTGQRCDQCSPGYFGFPNCEKCTCNEMGSISDLCDSTTGQCLCKENVEGLQCGRCKMGSFDLNKSNPQGCTECFCFGASIPAECHSSQYPSTEIYNMEGWRILNVADPEMIPIDADEGVRVNVVQSGGVIKPTAPIYWAAPEDYLRDKVASYGGMLRYTTTWELIEESRGDDVGLSSPEPILGAAADVILMGNQLTIGWANPTPSINNELMLKEHKFRHVPSGNEVTRQEMMMVLADLKSMHIRAAPVSGVASVDLRNVIMTTTDYNLPIGTAPSIPAVEECTCPEGYIGRSCQYCDVGYYREKLGPYLGYCRKCKCFGHCETCDDEGVPISSSDCLHNTDGPNCGVCKDGFIGNATSGDVEACTPCPCPRPSQNGNFADTCEEFEGQLVCYCKVGYTGDRCELCATGYFGNPGSVGGSCQPCNCHGNLDPNLIMEDCDTETGECTDCVLNTGGRYCERCADGFYGDAIVAKNCTECECSSCGTDQCDHMQGFCSCKPHVIGSSCDMCEPGYFGFSSCRGCRGCDCSEGALSSECDVTSGQCDCSPNVVGRRCDRCAPGFWNFSPSGCEPCNCRNNGRCNPVNGLCECPPGVTGPQCDQCELARHVLEPGDSQCSQCDSCIDDLLDTVEPMTENVKDAKVKLRNTSIGVAATKRLKELQDKADTIENQLETDEQFLEMASDAVIGTNSGGELEDDIASGFEDPASGDESESPAIDPMEDKLRALEDRINQTETDVAKMCRSTSEVHDQVAATKNRSDLALNQTNQLNMDAMDFQTEAKQLLDKLTAESSGDTEDYLEKLRDAEMMIQRMKERNMTDMRITAEEELEAARELMDQVQNDFGDPAANISSRANAVLEQYQSIHSKLHDIRRKMNNATADATSATTANAVNKKDLAEAKELIDETKANADMAMSDLTDAERLLASAQNFVQGPIPSGISDLESLADLLQQQTDELRPVAVQLESDVDRYGPFANISVEKALQLSSDADALDEIAQLGFNGSLVVANAYKKIVNLLAQADEAADDALMAARKASADVSDRNLQEEAEVAAERSSQLLSMTQDLESEDLAQLQNDMSTAYENVNVAEEKKDALVRMLDDLEDGIADLDRGNMDDRLHEVDEVVSNANVLSTAASARADELERLIGLIPEDINLQEEVTAVEDTLKNLESDVDSMKQKVDTTQRKSRQLDDLTESLGLQNQIIEIRKRIELTRNVANAIKDSMQIKQSDDVRSPHVQLRTPSSVQDVENFLQLQFAIKLDVDSQNNQLLYYGDGTAAGDFVSVETVDGRVRYQYKVGDGVGVLESEVAINTDQWHYITIVRWGKDGKLVVTYPTNEELRGDESGEESTSDDIQSGQTDGTSVTASMNAADSKLIMGSYTLDEAPPDVGRERADGMCVSDVRANNETIGMWNFVSYSGSNPGSSCQARGNGIASNQAWRFQGQGSYVRIRLSDTIWVPGPRPQYLGFKLETLQDNSLVFLIGNSTEQFLAMQVENGTLVLYWNFGFETGPDRAVVEENDITQVDTPLLIKAGFAPRSKFVLVTISLRYKLRRKFTVGAPYMQGDIWLGGVWPFDIDPGFRDILSNVDTSFRGCLQDFNINALAYDIQGAVEKIGVMRGCVKETVQTLGMQGNDYLRLIPDLQSAQDVKGGLNFETTTPSGTMVSVKETQGSTDEEEPSSTTLSKTKEEVSIEDMEESTDDSSSDGATESDNDKISVDSSQPGVLAPPETEEAAKLTAEKDEVTPGRGNVLPVILIVIGVIAGVALIAALISTLLRGGFAAGEGAAAVPAAQSPPEQTPLNQVQADRIAQMDW